MFCHLYTHLFYNGRQDPEYILQCCPALNNNILQSQAWPQGAGQREKLQGCQVLELEKSADFIWESRLPIKTKEIPKNQTQMTLTMKL